MPNITLAISEDLHARMRQHSEIRWSEVVRKTITQKIEDLDVMDKLTAKSKLTQRDVDEIASKVDRAVARKLSLRR
ncbi:hypothetical protein J4228_00145 [Candidatus Woesearchaeota archaeon]|nr:hypothetical protein [Candidatus Woesearchaeota archaeon]